MTRTEHTLRITWHGGDRFVIHAGRHTVPVDQPADFGGGDTGPSPVDLFVGSIAAAIAHCAERYLHRCQLPAGVEVTARYELEVAPARIARVELTVDAPAMPRGLRESFRNALEHCALCSSLRTPRRSGSRSVPPRTTPPSRSGASRRPATPPEARVCRVRGDGDVPWREGRRGRPPPSGTPRRTGHDERR